MLGYDEMREEARTARSIYQQIIDIVSEARPELAAEVRSFWHESPSKIGSFLDEHFPRGNSWGFMPINEVPNTLRHQIAA